MKKSNANGQVLSEKEMREVKGGAEITLSAEFFYCPRCGHPVISKEVIKDVLYVATCKSCGAPLPEKD